MTLPLWFPKRVVVATHNPGKLQEWRTLLGALGVHVRTPRELGLAAPEETESSYVGNARLKAVYAARVSGLAALADDTGFEVDALDGQPGLHTAQWAATHGGYPDALQALLELAEPGGEVRLVCAVALACADALHDAEASLRGVLRSRPTDAPGFAALFQTLGGEPLLEEGVLAHRRAALQRLISR